MAYVGKKTQIYVSEEQWRQLRRESGLTGLSVAEVVRRSIDEHFKSGAKTAGGFEAALTASAGLWRDRTDMGSSEEVIEELRAGWQDRQTREQDGRLSD
jgi:hypothetical protein